MSLGLNNRVSIVVGRLIGKVTTNQIANLAGYHIWYMMQDLRCTMQIRGSLGRSQGPLGLGQNNRVSIVVGRLIGKVTTNQIANLAGYISL